MNNFTNNYTPPEFSNTYHPEYFRLPADAKKLESLLESNQNIKIYDTILSQLAELIKISNPSKKLTKEESNELIKEHIGTTELKNYGVWVYYPWSERLVHLLDEEEFIKVRTSRNIYKLQPEQIQDLRKKKAGIIGLSVGQSIALTVATERLFGEIRLADFDEIELSNMNRLRVGVHEMCINKAVIAAREIAELDPFIKCVCYTDGITDDNIDDFFCKDGNIDILIEECDGIDVKVISRRKARELKIPVIMDTNDRGMLDVERFDLEPDRPLLHGRIDESITAAKLKTFTQQDKMQLLFKMVDIEHISSKMKFSLGEIGKTITTWPQLASSVVLGGAMIGDTCRRILTGDFKTSGRFYVDFEEIIK